MLTTEIMEQITILVKEHGDFPIYVYADHGQTAYAANSVTVEVIDSDGEIIHQDDIDDFAPEELTKVVLVSD